MKLSIKNVGKLKEADVEINGITVITGENDTGKSTVGKVLWSVFNSFYEIKNQVRKDKINSIFRESRRFLGLQQSRKLRNKIVQESEIDEEIDLDDLINQIEINLRVERNNNKEIERILDKIKKRTKLPEKEVLKEIIQKNFDNEFNYQINNLNLLKNGNIVLDIKNKQIEELQNFIKYQFVEMFGNPIINDKKFEFKQIGEVTKIVTGTTPDTNDIENWNGRINWITPAEIKDDTLYVYDTQRKITEKGQKSKALTLMPKGTVIFSTRAPIGKTAIAGNEMCCNQGFKNCICSININNTYLYYVLKNNKIYFNNLGTGATFKELSKRVFEKVKIAVPPITLQNQFSEIVKQIDKQKFGSMIQLDKENRIVLRNIIKDTLEETNSIYEFLLKKYFEEGK